MQTNTSADGEAIPLSKKTGEVPANGLDTAAVLRSTRDVIRIQEAADRGEREVGFVGLPSSRT